MEVSSRSTERERERERGACPNIHFQRTDYKYIGIELDKF